MGYLLALVSSLFFSLYIIPRKLTKIKPAYFGLLMSSGFLLSSVLLYLFRPFVGFQEVIGPKLIWVFLAGIVWAGCFVLYVTSIDHIGLSRSNQWKSLQGPIATLLGLFVLSESSSTNVTFVILAAVMIFISAVFLSATSSGNLKDSSLKGVLLALCSGLGFGLVTMINKYITVQVGVYSQQVVWSFGIFISLFTYLLYVHKSYHVLKGIASKDILLGLVAGLVYTGASFFALQSYKLIPVSVGITIIQLSSIWTIAIGIFLFKEIDLRKHSKNTIFGLIFALISLMFLLYTKK